MWFSCHQNISLWSERLASQKLFRYENNKKENHFVIDQNENEDILSANLSAVNTPSQESVAHQQ